MILLFALAGAAFGGATLHVAAQTPPPQTPPTQTPPKPDAKKPDNKKPDNKKPPKPAKPRPVVTWTLQTTRGAIVIALDPQEAPGNVANLVSLTQNGFYGGLTFHRVEDWVAQGGDPKGNGSGGPGYSVTNETNKALKNVRGAVGMANSGRDTAGSQFYILKKDAPSLDGGNYTLVGTVVSGMEAVDALQIGDRMTQVSVTLPDGYKAAAFGPSRPADATALLYPSLPDDAASRAFSRTLRIKVSVPLSGAPTVSVTRSCGDTDVDDAVAAAIRRWNWSPALKGGRPVASTQEFEYDLNTGSRRYDR